ncbi:hypothetical protein D3C75_1326720 [compost metagenome]
MALQIFRQEYAHLRDMRRHFRGLGNNGDIQVTQTIAFSADAFPGLTQQNAAVGPFECRVGIREQLADIP